MGRWGENFFEGDTDLDEVSYISADAGVELYNFEKEENEEYDCGGIGLEATREHLNNGVLARLFEEYETKPLYCVDKELRFVFLGTRLTSYPIILRLMLFRPSSNASRSNFAT